MSGVRQLTWDPYEEPGEGAMRFRLTYEGRLLATHETPAKPEHKHDIRRQFHPQLRDFWGVNPGLKYLTKPNPSHRQEHPIIEDIAKTFAVKGFSFVPLGRTDLNLMCKIEVLLLRRPATNGGGVYANGDLDNRVKTLLDALAIPPLNAFPLGVGPTADEQPYFYVLLDDDKMISHLSVETDYLFGDVVKLDAHGKRQPPDVADVRATLTISLQPYSMSRISAMYGLVFG